MSEYNFFNKIIEIIYNVLPLSPFTSFIDNIENDETIQGIFGLINWFIPISDMIVVMLAWVGAISLYYLYSIVLRWIKAIK